MNVDSLAFKRMQSLFDDGMFTEMDRMGDNGVVVAYGMVNGTPCCAFSQNVESDGAAMTAKQAAKIGRAYALAEKIGCPIVGIFDSNGGKLSDGMDAVCAFSELIASADRLSGVVPQVSIIAGTCAASAAVWAQCADVVIMSDKGQLFVTAPSLLGDRVGNADTAVANGTAHIACDSDLSAVATAREALAFLPSNNISCAAECDCVPATNAFPATDAASAIAAVCDEGSVLELRKGFGTDSITAFGRIAGSSVGIVAAYGTLAANDCSKIASFVGICDAFSIPLVTLVDTVGYESSVDSELDGNVKAASVLTKAYANATTVKVAMITGKAYGPAFMTFAGKSSGADAVLAFDCAVISPLAPEAAATIVYNDRILAGEDKQVVLADYLANDASAQAVATKGIVDDVVTAEDAYAKLLGSLDILASKRVTTLDKKHVVLSF